jgi:hypothetical protein
MKKTLLASFVVLAGTVFAAGNAFKVDIFQDSLVDGKTLKAGNYKIMMENGNAVIKQGNQTIEIPAREENEPNKIASTELIYKDTTNLQEIRVGGTHTRILFEEGAAPMHAGQ